MKTAVWLAANGLRWLTVIAFVAWLNPQPLHFKTVMVPTPPVLLRTIQLAPCPPWAIRMGHWGTANVCATYPASQAIYLHHRWRHR